MYAYYVSVHSRASASRWLVAGAVCIAVHYLIVAVPTCPLCLLGPTDHLLVWLHRCNFHRETVRHVGFTVWKQCSIIIMTQHHHPNLQLSSAPQSFMASFSLTPCLQLSRNPLCATWSTDSKQAKLKASAVEWLEARKPDISLRGWLGIKAIQERLEINNRFCSRCFSCRVDDNVAFLCFHFQRLGGKQAFNSSKFLEMSVGSLWIAL